MVEVRNIRVFSIDRDAISVTWEIGETTADLSTYTTYVLRSTAQAGPYTPVSLGMVSRDFFDFQDRGVNQLSKWREFYYRIRLVDGSGHISEFGSTPNSEVVVHGLDPGGVSMAVPPDLEALEAIRRFELVSQEYAGRKVLFLPMRRWGQRCSLCWDALKRRVNSSQCPSCFSVGFSGGYHFPRESYVINAPDDMRVALTGLLTIEPHDVLRWASPAVRLSPGDLVVDTQNRRWSIIGIKRNSKSDALTWQILQLRELSRDQVAYKIPVSWSADSMTAGPARQYIRATDIDSFRKAAQKLGLPEAQNEIRGLKTNVEGS